MTTAEITSFIVNIAQALAVIISVVSVCVTVIVSSRDNKRKNYLSVEVSSRMNVLGVLRENFAKILLLTTPNVVDEYKQRQSNNYIEALFTTAKNLRISYKSVYKHDIYVLNALTEATDIAVQYYHGKVDAEKLAEINLRLENISDICIGAYWAFIKSQSNGQHRVGGDYEKIFNAWMEKVEKKESQKLD